jgi:hypothetical protein
MIYWWMYTPEDGGEEVLIGSLDGPSSPEAAAVALKLIWTADPEQAEEWRQALAKGKFPKHDPLASELVFLRWLQRKVGMSLDQLAARHRRDPGMAQLVEILRSEAAAAQTLGGEGDGVD